MAVIGATGAFGPKAHVERITPPGPDKFADGMVRCAEKRHPLLADGRLGLVSA
ncbi:hypothetical protein [Bradyrhizobium sp. B120]|uniref:hypothetical protein n=1 Tax=Bradyrhizobium sp. B120 TaxID=3410088 RepID=UPI003B984A11